jgi:hypothetical protein
MQTNKLFSFYYFKIIKIYEKYLEDTHWAMVAKSWGIIWSKNDFIWDHL